MLDRRLFTAFALAAALAALDGAVVAQHDEGSSTRLSVGDVADVVNDDNWVVVDTRTTDA